MPGGATDDDMDAAVEMERKAVRHLATLPAPDRAAVGTKINALLDYLEGCQIDIPTLRMIAADALRRAKEEAETANHAKDHFLAVLSHELRTPLHQVLGALELARWQSTNAEQIKWLDRCTAAAKTLQRLIDDVLDLTQLKANRISLDRAEFTLDLFVLVKCNVFGFSDGTEPDIADLADLTVETDGISIGCGFDDIDLGTGINRGRTA